MRQVPGLRQVDERRRRRAPAALLTLGAFVAALLGQAPAYAQSGPAPQQAAPPPQQAAPPQQYPPPAYPPQQYPPQQYPPPAYPPPGYYTGPHYQPYMLPYNEGQEVLPGYHLENRVRKGGVIGGALLMGIPYLLGLTIASALDYDYGSGWLAVPVAGPWALMLANPSNCDPNTDSSCTGERVLNSFLRFYLALDGIAQAGGAVLLLWGLNGRTLQVRDDVSYALVPTRVGRDGYGAVFTARF